MNAVRKNVKSIAVRTILQTRLTIVRLKSKKVSIVRKKKVRKIEKKLGKKKNI